MPHGASALTPPGSGPQGFTRRGFFFGLPMRERAVVFVDGNNWYHALKDAGVLGQGWLNYAKVSQKIVGPRDWTATRYYTGQVQQRGNTQLYADQRRYMSWLERRDKRISIHYGRLEDHRATSECAQELKRYLAHLPVRIDSGVYQELSLLASRHATAVVTVEKAVDVMIAVDLVRMADRDAYDAAYILSADGDYTPAVKAAQEAGKKVFAAALRPGAQLAAAVYKFIPLSPEWLTDCFGE
jgi:uncharacterized LabA/DUF88 family protein